MFHVIDTFNDRRISSHRSLEAAIKADKAYNRAVKKANGQNSYIPTEFREGGSQHTWREKSSHVNKYGESE